MEQIKQGASWQVNEISVAVSNVSVATGDHVIMEYIGFPACDIPDFIRNNLLGRKPTEKECLAYVSRMYPIRNGVDVPHPEVLKHLEMNDNVTRGMTNTERLYYLFVTNPMP